MTPHPRNTNGNFNQQPTSVLLAVSWAGWRGIQETGGQGSMQDPCKFRGMLANKEFPDSLILGYSWLCLSYCQHPITNWSCPLLPYCGMAWIPGHSTQITLMVPPGLRILRGLLLKTLPEWVGEAQSSKCSQAQENGGPVVNGHRFLVQ